MRLPGRNAPRSSVAQVGERRVRILQRAVDHDVVLGEVRRERHRAVLGVDRARRRALSSSCSNCDDVDRGDRRADGGDPAVGQHPDVVDAVRVEGGDGTAGGRAESDHDGAEAAAVVARRAAELQGVEHRAVAGELVVLVEDVEPEAAVGLPVVHRLPGDQREALVDRELGDLAILHAVRPAPQHLAVAQVFEVGCLRLRQQHDVRCAMTSSRSAIAADQRLELRVGDAEPEPVAALEDHAAPAGPRRSARGAPGGSAAVARRLCATSPARRGAEGRAEWFRSATR